MFHGKWWNQKCFEIADRGRKIGRAEEDPQEADSVEDKDNFEPLEESVFGEYAGRYAF